MTALEERLRLAEEALVREKERNARLSQALLEVIQVARDAMKELADIVEPAKRRGK